MVLHSLTREGVRLVTAVLGSEVTLTGDHARSNVRRRRRRCERRLASRSAACAPPFRVSLAWMGAEGAVAIVAGIMAGSIALIGFGSTARSRASRAS